MQTLGVSSNSLKESSKQLILDSKNPAAQSAVDFARRKSWGGGFLDPSVPVVAERGHDVILFFSGPEKELDKKEGKLCIGAEVACND